MIRISSIGLSFISIVGNPCRPAAGSFPVGPIEPTVERRPKVKVSKDVNYRLVSKHQLTMRDNTMSIYTHRSQDSPFLDALSLDCLKGCARRRPNRRAMRWNQR